MRGGPTRLPLPFLRRRIARIESFTSNQEERETFMSTKKSVKNQGPKIQLWHIAVLVVAAALFAWRATSFVSERVAGASPSTVAGKEQGPVIHLPAANANPFKPGTKAHAIFADKSKE